MFIFRSLLFPPICGPFEYAHMYLMSRRRSILKSLHHKRPICSRKRKHMASILNWAFNGLDIHISERRRGWEIGRKSLYRSGDNFLMPLTLIVQIFYRKKSYLTRPVECLKQTSQLFRIENAYNEFQTLLS